MALYIEYVIIDNYVIDYILLKFIESTFGYIINKFNKHLTCVLGVILAIFLPFLYSNKLLLLCYRILVSLILVLCIKKYKKFKEFVTYYLMFVTYTFLIGGVVLGIIQMLGIEYSMSGLFMYNFEFPVGLLALILLIIFRVIFVLLKVIKIKLKHSNYIYKIKLCDGKNTIDSYAFWDSGNNVKFNESGVSIVSINLFLKMYKDIDLNKVISRTISNEELRNVEYIYISGIGEGDKYLSFEIDSIVVGKKVFINQRIAVAMKNFGEYDCILHKDFVKGEI